MVHDVKTLIGQRVFGLALGYEDLNDHDTLRHDPAIGVTLDQIEPGRSDCAPLAGKSTLNRWELAAAGQSVSKHRKIVADFDAMDTLKVELFIESCKVPPKEIVLDAGATDVPLYGDQEGKFFHGTYKEYCTLPLLVFCDRMPVLALLRSARKDVATDITPVLDRMVRQIREHWPDVRIILRTDSGFCREAVLAWAEGAGVDTVIGLAGNSRLNARIAKANPRFIVTSLPASTHPAQPLYEKFYCARGDAENRVKEHKRDMLSDRLSTTLFDANALRFKLATFAFILVELIRQSLAGTKLAKARPETLRLRLLRIGAKVKISTRRVHIAMSSAFPDKDLFGKSWRSLVPP